MKKRKNLRWKIIGVIILIIVLLTIGLFTLFDYNFNSKSQIKNSNHDNILSYPNEEISSDEIEALSAAINDEYKARATYKRVIEELGDVKPFSNIINAENTHISQLESIYNKYNLEIPQDTWYDKIPTFTNINDACSAGVTAEIENANLYDELMKKVDNQDIIVVFISLRDASRNNHLPAFQRCRSN